LALTGREGPRLLGRRLLRLVQQLPTDGGVVARQDAGLTGLVEAVQAADASLKLLEGVRSRRQRLNSSVLARPSLSAMVRAC